MRFFLFVLFGIFFIQGEIFANFIFNGKAQEISDSGFDAKIVTSQDAKYVYVVFSTATSLQIKTSSDFGKSFSPPVDIGTNKNYSPQITTNNTGQYVYIIWVDNTSIYTSMSEDFGKNFSALKVLDTNANNLSYPQIISSSSGDYVYAIWKDASDNIKFSSSQEYAKRWFESSQLDGSSCSYPQIATDCSGKYIYAVWQNVESIVVKTSDNYGNSFSSATQLDLNGDRANIATNNDGEWVYVFYRDLSDTMLVQVSPDHGHKWYIANKLECTGCLQNQIITDNTGKYIYCTWNTGNIYFGYSSDYGINFNTIKLDEKGSYPHIATDETGKIIILTWLDEDGYIESKISSDGGNNLSSATIVSQTKTSSFTKTDIALDKKGEYFYFLWGDIESFNPIGFISGECFSSSE